MATVAVGSWVETMSNVRGNRLALTGSIILKFYPCNISILPELAKAFVGQTAIPTLRRVQPMQGARRAPPSCLNYTQRPEPS